jgi:hypothetical protein
MDEKNNLTNSTLPGDDQAAQNEVRVDLSGGQAPTSATDTIQDTAPVTSEMPPVSQSDTMGSDAPHEPGTTFVPSTTETYTAAVQPVSPNPTEAAAEVGQAATESAGIVPPQSFSESGPLPLQNEAASTPAVTPLGPEQPTPVPPMTQGTAPLLIDDPSTTPPPVPSAAPDSGSKVVLLLAGVAVVLLAVIAALYFVL